MQKPKRIVKVDWIDSAEWSGWRDDCAEMKPCTCQTVGFLLRSNKNHIVIAGSHSDGNSWISHIVIPRGAITAITDLKE